MSEETKKVEEEAVESEEKTEEGKKKSFFSQNSVEILVAIFLGITALLTAWASWIGSLHGGNQSTNYTKSNNLAAQGNSEYNEGMQLYLSDVLAWNTRNEYLFDKEIALSNGQTEAAEIIEEKLQNYLDQNGSEILVEAYKQMTEDMNSPFEVKGMKDKYFEHANELLEESQEVLEEGQRDNARGDAYNLVSVIYSVVLFMLGIVGIFKKIPNRAAVLFIAVGVLVVATIYMFTIPMPTGFSIGSFFGAK